VKTNITPQLGISGTPLATCLEIKPTKRLPAHGLTNHNIYGNLQTNYT